MPLRPVRVLLQVGGPGVIDPDHNVTAVVSIDDLLASEPAASEPNDAWSDVVGERPIGSQGRPSSTCSPGSTN